MKKSELFANVKAAVELAKSQEVQINKDLLAGQLMGLGASLSMVARELPKALKANGIVTATNTGSEELAKVREAVKLALKGVKAKGKEGDDNYRAKVEAREIATYRDLRKFSEELEDEFPITSDAAMKVIKSELKDLKKEVPSKAKLGAVKEAIVEYFAGTPSSTTSLEGLAAYLQTVTDDDGVAMDKDKALHASRMNYTFAKMLVDGVTINQIN